MRHRLLYHLTWTTRDREPLITLKVAQYLDQSLRTLALKERSRILEIGIVSTHVHVLLRAHPCTSIPRLIQRLKGATATLGSRELSVRLRWEKGYNIESLGVRALGTAMAYVRNQSGRHPDQAIEGWRQDQ